MKTSSEDEDERCLHQEKCLLSKILEFNQYEKSDKTPSIIYADLESLIQKINGGKSNPTKSSTAKLGEHTSSGFSMSTILLFKDIKNKHEVYRGKDYMKKFCECLKKHAKRIINFEKKKMKL